MLVVLPLSGGGSTYVRTLIFVTWTANGRNLRGLGRSPSPKLCLEAGVAPPPSVTRPTNPAMPTVRPPSLRPPSASPPTTGGPTPPTTPALPPTSGPGGRPLVTAGFDQDMNGNEIVKGQCAENEWISLGLTLFADGEENSLIRKRAPLSENVNARVCSPPRTGVCLPTSWSRSMHLLIRSHPLQLQALAVWLLPLAIARECCFCAAADVRMHGKRRALQRPPSGCLLAFKA